MAISIDMGTRAIHIASGRANKNGSVVLQSSNHIKIPPELYAESPVNQQRSIFGLLKPMLNTMKVKGENCHFTLSDDRFLIRDLVLPKASLEILRGVAKQEMVSLYNADENSAIEINAVKPRQDGKLSLRAAAFDKELADGYLQFTLDCNMKPTTLSCHSVNISKLMASKPVIDGTPIAKRNIVLVDMGMFACIVHVIIDGRAAFSRYLPVGFNELHSVLTASTQQVQANGETVLSTTSLEASFDTNSATYIYYPPHIAEQVEAFLFRLTDEMSKMLRYIISSKVALNVDAIYLFGGGSRISGLAARLYAALGMYVNAISSVSNIGAPASLAGNIPFLLNCAGSLIE